MSHQKATPDILTAEQKEIIAVVRVRLESRHNVDTSSLDDLEIMTRLVIIKDITGDGNVLQVLSEFSDKFMDLSALVGEMMMAAEGTRH
jgi:hypothetical protein